MAGSTSQTPGTEGAANSTQIERAAGRLASISRLLGACASLLYRLAQLTLIALVCLAGLLLVLRFGRFAAGSHDGSSLVRYHDTPRTAVAADPIPWDKVDAAVAAAAGRARTSAEQFASTELDRWNAQLLARIDSDFLPWYFGYWNQQLIGLRAVWQGAKYELAGYVTADDTPTASQQMAADIQQEFADRVLRPQSAQLFLEQVTRKMVDVYLGDLRRQLSLVQVTYKVPQAQWDRYLEDISLTTQRIEGSRQVPLTLKTLAGSTLGAGTLLAATLTRIAGRFELTTAARTAEATTEQLAARAATQLTADMGERLAVSAGEKAVEQTGVKVVGKLIGRFAGPIAAAGIIAWDLYDHHATVAQNWPLLRDSLVEYLSLMKESLLHDPQTGLAAPIHEVETAIVKSVGNNSAIAKGTT